MADEHSSESTEGVFGRVPDDIEVPRRPRRPIQGSVAGASIVSNGSVTVFGHATCRTLDKIIRDEVIVQMGDCGAPGLKNFVTNRSAATQALLIMFLLVVLASCVFWCLQAMMLNCSFKDPFGRSQVHPPIIQAKFASTSSCAIPRCQSCELACARVRSPKVKKVQSNIDSEGAISHNKLDIGDFVSTDQFVCRTPGRLPSGYGCEGTNG